MPPEQPKLTADDAVNAIPLPESCEEHASKYKPQSWTNYSFQELGSFVHLLAKRAEHRTQQAKVTKDLTDARNYLRMMEAKLDAIIERNPDCGPL